MARKKTVIETTDDEDETLEGESDEDGEAFLETLGPDTKKISVYRMDARTGKYAYVGALNPEMLKAQGPALIQETYGGGEFFVRLAGQDGRWQKSKAVSVETPRGDPAQPGPAQAINPEASLMRAQLEMMQAQYARTQELLIHLIDKPTPAPPQQNDLGSVVTAFAALGKLANPQAQTQGIVSALTEGIKLGMKNNGGNGSENKIEGWLRVLDKVGEYLPRVFPQPQPQPQPAGLGLESPPQAPAAGPQAGALGTDPQLALRELIKYLKTKVSKDPNIWAEWIADNLDEGHWVIVAQLIELPYEEIARIVGDPELNREPYKTWFSQLLTGLKFQLGGNEDDVRGNTDPPRPGGDSRNAKPNGPANS